MKLEDKKEYYNVKVYDYGSEIQLRTYEKPIKKGGIIDKKEIAERDKRTYEEKLSAAKTYDEKTSVMKANERSVTASQNRSKNKVYEYARANEWEYFITLTFDPDKIDRYDYSVCSDKVSQWLKNMKKDYAKDLKYIVVPELHEDGAYHFHALFSDIGDIKLVYSGLNCVGKDKFKSTEDSGNGHPLYNLGNYKLGWTTAMRIIDTKKASNYLSKYITKDLVITTTNKKRYWNSRNLIKPSVSVLLLNDNEMKKQLESIKDQVAHKNTVDIDLPSYNQTVTYYECIIT